MKKFLSILFSLIILLQIATAAFADGQIWVYGDPADGGTISSVDGTDSDGNPSLIVTATPDKANGYEFYKWRYTVTGGAYKDIDLVSSETVTENFTKYPTEDRSVTAMFRKRQIVITANTVGSGTVTGAGSYGAGEIVTLTANPGKGYTFSCWNDNPSMSDPTYSFPASVNSTFTAVFVSQKNTITTSVEPADTGYVVGNTSPYDYAINPVASLGARPITGYKFDGWYENGSLISYQKDEVFDTDRNRTLVAKFSPETSTSIFDPSSSGTGPTVTVVPPAGTTYTITYQPSAGASGSVYSHSYNVNEVAYLLGSGYYSKPGYTQTGWTEDYNGAGYKYNLNSGFILTKNVTLYPYWEKSTVPLSLTVSIGPGGGVRLSGGTVPNGWTGTLEPNQSFTFYFHPYPGNYVYRIGFAGWHWPVQSGNSFTVTYDMMQGKNQTLQILFADARSHPPTGDDSQIALHIALGLASLAGLVVLEVVRRKRNKEAEKEVKE